MFSNKVYLLIFSTWILLWFGLGTHINDLQNFNNYNIKNVNFLRDLNNKSLNDYSNENVSQRVLFLVKSYIEYANTRFWFKK